MKQESISGDICSNGPASQGIASELYAAPSGLSRPLRITLVVPERVPAWLARFVDLASGTSWIDFSILPIAGAEKSAGSRLPIGLRVLLALEKARCRRGGAMLASVPIHGRGGAPIALQVRADAASAQLGARVAESQPDLVLLLGSQDWAETIAGCADWGCWILDASLTDPDRAGIALLAPLLHDESATKFELELQGPSRRPVELVASWGATCVTSFTSQRDRAFQKLPALLLRALHRLATGDLPLTRRRAATLRQAPEKLPLGLAAGARALVTTMRAAARARLQKLRREPSWFLVLRQDVAPLDPDAPEVHSHVVVRAPLDGFWADPCVVETNGRHLVFVEELEWQTRKGTITCVELDHGRARRLGCVLEEPVHLSYPQVFEWEGQWYLTVESSKAKRVSLYRAADFPLGWQRIHDLITDRVCVDPTLHYHEGFWYLFANVAENGSSTWDELFLFVSEQLTGPFLPHPASPIVTDVRRARPAGRLFHSGGRLVRPAQDCAPRYGAALVFNEVLELSPTRYRERQLSRLAPDWADSLDQCHTYSAAGGVEVLDARGYPRTTAARFGRIHAPAKMSPA